MDGPTTPAQRAELRELLAVGELEVLGRITDASNIALLVAVGPDSRQTRAIYKPIRGERPLWDFPDGTLAGRETASALLAEVTGYGIVPPTVLRAGPLGPGSVQLWIGDPFAEHALATPVRLTAVGGVPDGWLAVLDGQLPNGEPVTVIHEDASDVRDAAVLDAILNNSDRKGSHLVRDGQGTLWGFDHGLTLHADPKLRTVLWGWAGKPLRDSDLQILHDLAEQLADSDGAVRAELAALLPAADLTALIERVRLLLSWRKHPRPSRDWPSIPWPAL